MPLVSVRRPWKFILVGVVVSAEATGEAKGDTGERGERDRVRVRQRDVNSTTKKRARGSLNLVVFVPY